MHAALDSLSTTIILFIVKPIACVMTNGRMHFSWENVHLEIFPAKIMIWSFYAEFRNLLLNVDSCSDLLIYLPLASQFTSTGLGFLHCGLRGLDNIQI